MPDPLPITVDRTAKASLSTQIHDAIRTAIVEGRLGSGARLPSWRDLATQLGVARGTVRAAYERLVDEQWIVSQGAAGTRVASRLAPRSAAAGPIPPAPLAELYPDFEHPPLSFQMGIPAQDAFPSALWARMLARGARAAATAPVSYPDPRGRPDLRREIAAYLAIARGLPCDPSQVLVTAGYAGALCLALTALGMTGRTAWHEDPGYILTRRALGLAGVAIAAVPVDTEGLDVAEARRRAPDAALAIVTPGQQSPLGMTMSLARRSALLAWARESGGFILEDDYLGELQLKGRAAPALASLDADGRVLHAGTFSKTISPALRLGFLVVPPHLVAQAGEVAACLAPAPAATVQHAMVAFMAEGHYLRHLRRMKRLYAARREALATALRAAAPPGCAMSADGGLAVRLWLPEGTDDRAVAARALQYGLAPAALSSCFVEHPRPGLMLGVTNLAPDRLAADCSRLLALVDECR